MTIRGFKIVTRTEIFQYVFTTKHSVIFTFNLSKCVSHSAQRVKSSRRRVFYYLIAKDALVVGNMECIKEQLRVLRHASLINIQKLLHKVHTYICDTFFFVTFL